MNTLTVSDVIAMMETLAPPHLAEEWDNVGLQIGSKDWPVEKIWVALDPTSKIIQKACKDGVDLLITHHPMFFKPLRTINVDTLQGRIVKDCICNKLSVYSAHTNLDSVRGGLNDIFADRIGLSDCRILDHATGPKKFKLIIIAADKHQERLLNILPKKTNRVVGRCAYAVTQHSTNAIQPKERRGSQSKEDIDNPPEVKEAKIEAVLSEKEIDFVLSQLRPLSEREKIDYEIYPLLDLDYDHGLGRVGNLQKPLNLKELALNIKQRLKLHSIRMVGDPGLMATKVAVCTGSGAGLLKKFIASDAQVYISGDIKYHEALSVLDAGKGLIDVGHFASEQIMIDAVAFRLNKWIGQSVSFPVTVKSSRLETDPFLVL